MSEHSGEPEFEYIENAPVDSRLKEAIMLSSPPREGAHLAGVLCISMWHSEKDGGIETDVIVTPSDARKEVLHVGWHTLDEILRAGKDD